MGVSPMLPIFVVAGFGIKITRLLACSTVWESTVLLTDYLWQNIHFTDMISGLVSISLTFYEQLLRQNPFTKKLQTQIVSN